MDSNILEMFPDLRESGLVLRSGPNWFVNVADKESFAEVWGHAEAAFSANKEAVYASDRVRMKHRWLQDYLLELARQLDITVPAPYLAIFDPVR